MPTYQNVTPPISLFSGDVGFSFNNETFPAANTAGSQFALPSFTGLPDSGTAVRWQTIFGTAPTAVSIVLQGAMSDIDAEYQTIDTTVATTGEARTVASVQAKFLRIKFVSSTGGTGLTAKLLVWRAVLTQALEDAESTPIDGETGAEPLEASRARRYLRADSPFEAEDLKLVCAFADLPADRVFLWARRQYPLAERL